MRFYKMVLLSAAGLTKVYGVETILSEVSFHLNKGDRVGIVGANGAGKTTLLNLLAGELAPDGGSLFLSPEVSVGYLRQRDRFSSEKTVYEEMLSIFQELLDMEAELQGLSEEIAARSGAGEDTERLLERYDRLTAEFRNRNGYGFRGEINGVLSSMAFPEEYYHKPCSILSGGESTRLALAALLLRKPELLLLDEPTNHLDIGTLKWLEQYLKNAGGTLVLISHDRYFLDQTVERIFEIENRRLTIYEGNYSAYVEKKRQRQEDALRHYERQQEEIARQEELIRRFKERGTEKLVKRAQSREKRLAHVDRLEKPEAVKNRMAIRFREKFPSGHDVLLAEELAKGFGEAEEYRRLFSGVSLDVKRGERVCMVGANGIGKTTLLKLIMGALPPDGGYLRLGHNVVPGYYDQEQRLLSGENSVLEEIHGAYRLYSETELRSLLGRFLFRGDDVFKLVKDLSGGEKARLSLLKLMLSGANFLLMDEPTNHLDIAAKEVFEDALMEFPGTLLLVSHDRYFLNKVPTRIIELTETGLVNYLGKYDYYTEKKQSVSSGKEYLSQLGRRDVGEEGERAAVKERRMAEWQREKEQKAARQKRERERRALEERIQALEERAAFLKEEMGREELATDYERLAGCHRELEAVDRELEEALAR
ncbi:MAG: ABC-F family ATP-binding cassette domain-containing protein, partial [Bacillota bacterium]|nr:ABC-F family ATP-binding cassette domain-containing protein [Bacillota bacterium]